MEFSDFSNFINLMQQEVYLPFSNKIASFTLEAYQKSLCRGLTDNDAILHSISVSASKAFRDALTLSLFFLLLPEKDRPKTKDEMRELFKRWN